MLLTWYRRRRYPKLLKMFPLEAFNTKTIVPNLFEVWRCVEPKDFRSLSSQIMRRKGVVTHSPNIVTLSRWLDEINKEIQKEYHQELLIRVKNLGGSDVREFDMYMTDDRLYEVDFEKELRRLKDLILVHRNLLKKESGFFYQRLCLPFYEDLVNLTYVLLEETDM